MYTGEARLDGKNAIVTGSNTGIGKCTVLDFVTRGEIQKNKKL
jgi:NAD(P)-dependent dehydrogenase (short-subunit alcohol dehydrogenase family)